MPNQNDYNRVYGLVKEPLLTLYGGALDDAFVEALVEDLARFDNETLKAAVREVRGACKRMPTIAHLVEACRRCAPSPSESVRAPGTLAPWEEMDRRAAALAAEFLGDYASTPLAIQAHREGWLGDLRAYAADAAGFQASIIAGARNHGYSSAAIAWDGTGASGDAVRRRRAQFEEACRRQAATGAIAVDVPNDAIAYWRARAAQRKLTTVSI